MTMIQSKELLQAASQDIDVLAALAMPEDCTAAFPVYYQALYMEILAAVQNLERSFPKYAIGFPRGFVKTTFLKIIILAAIVFSKRKFVLVVCASEALAVNLLQDVWDILTGQEWAQYFPGLVTEVTSDSATKKVCVVLGRVLVLRAVGAETSFRGINIKKRRPDLMIFDDAQTVDCAESVEESRKFQRKFFGTMLKAADQYSCVYIYVGNMYQDLHIGEGQYSCLLRNLQLNPNWMSYIVGAILEDGTSLWEELQPLKQLLQELAEDRAAGQEGVFYAEKLNDPKATPYASVDLSKTPIKEKLAGELHQGNFIIIDPATEKKTSDQICYNYFECYDVVPYSMEISYGKHSPSQTIVHALEMAIRLNCNLIVVEAVAYQYTLLHWFQVIAEQQGITGIEFLPIYPGGVSKNSRILQMLKSLTTGALGASKDTYPLIAAQVRAWNPHARNNLDDILDTMAYAEKVMVEYGANLILEGSIATSMSPQLPPADSFESAF